MTEHYLANRDGGFLHSKCGSVPAVDIRRAGRRLWLDPATDEWVLEQDGQVTRSQDKTEIERILDRLDMMEHA